MVREKSQVREVSTSVSGHRGVCSPLLRRSACPHCSRLLLVELQEGGGEAREVVSSPGRDPGCGLALHTFPSGGQQLLLSAMGLQWDRWHELRSPGSSCAVFQHC